VDIVKVSRYHEDPDCKHANLVVQRNDDYRWVTCTDCMTQFYPRRRSPRDFAEEKGWKLNGGEYLDLLTAPPYAEDQEPRK